MKRFLAIVLCILFCCCRHAAYKNPHVRIQTADGDIELELYPDKAPKTVAAFLNYVDSGLYKNSSFYRVLKDEDQPSNSFKAELIQGGIWQTNYKKGLSLSGIQHEPTNITGIAHKNGTISLARTTPGTASSEFFICIGDQPFFDYGGEANPDKQGFAAFGKVVKGMNIVRSIHHKPNSEYSFDPPVPIFDIIRL